MQEINSRIKIFLIAVIVVLFLVGIYFLVFANNGAPVTGVVVPDSLDTANLPSTDKVKVRARSGGYLEVNNFLIKSSEVATSRVMVISDLFWSVVYEPLSGTFYATTGANDEADLDLTLINIEGELSKYLGINPDQVCDLLTKIVVTSNQNINLKDQYEFPSCRK